MPDKKWKIEFFNNKTKNEYELWFSDIPERKAKFEDNVTDNPFYHPVSKRIVKLRGGFEELWRWKQSETRVVYHPDKATHTVFPIETGSATDISYKKRSRRKKRSQ